VAVIVVPLVVPSARTFVPLVMAEAVVALVPFRYFVEDVAVTVTFWAAEVVMVKPVLVTLSTVPIAPPAAAADRALLPWPPVVPPPGPGRCAVDDDDDGAGFVADDAVAEQPATSPAAATIAPTAIH
jgi:hypothetical protein